MQDPNTLGAGMNRTGNSLRRVRKGVTAAMAAATNEMRHQEGHLNDISRSLRDACKQYTKSLKETREADKYTTAAMNKQASARAQENSLIMQALASREGSDDHCHECCDGPDF